ncbi:HDOD domain-containing protein [Pseudoalteromonas sp. CnMc7-15]|uniref:EAL and HDOD domain-containing protein n=1 Tax=unclassified Pseudoalteromonas TaxID=194690 RepID=UPI001EF534B8|nr:HDOD domain-containing protein [Pseudoalteromonas sp. CnMc7-15]MCG7567301.1 HDOD domain-containing protein [Pseudoalteromonas sp. CnMc7-15]
MQQSDSQTPSQLEAQYVARQALFSSSGELVAYELLYRDSPQNCFPQGMGDSKATGRMFFDLILLQGLEKVSAGLPAFLNLATDALLEQIPQLLPKDNTVIEIVERSRGVSELVHVVSALKKKGYRFALDDYDQDPKWQPLLELVDYIKIEMEPKLISTVMLIKKLRMVYPQAQIIVERIETPEQAKAVVGAGVDLLQGYFFAKPAMLEFKNISPAKRVIIELLQLTMSAEIDFKEIAKRISVDVSLTARILRMANGLSGTRANISSLQQAVTYLGEQSIRRFIRVLALGELGAQKPAELTKLGLMRAQLIAELVSPAGKAMVEQGYLLGLLSVLDAVLDVSLENLAKEFSLDGALSGALLNAKGMLGQALNLAYACEQCQWPLAEEILQTIRPASEPQVLYAALSQSRIYCDKTMELLSD